ncbi:MAG: hypothetical protein M1167_04290 [Chloroflexi bacterium]|nr:hypothetical protein [Chloroflexota bacterium]
MISPKLKMLIAVAAAVLLGLLLLPISYLLTPQSNQKPLPMPVPSSENQIFVASLWIGVALLISVSVVGILILAYCVVRKVRK